jgi:hypothetical protein
MPSMSAFRAWSGVVAVALAACGPPAAAKLKVSQPTLNCGAHLIGASYQCDPAVTWTNAGAKDGRVARLDLAGAEATSFSVVPDPLTTRLRPGENTVPVTVSFRPVKKGAHTASATPALSGDGTAEALPLSGEGIWLLQEIADVAVTHGGGGAIDPDKPVNCGRVEYGQERPCEVKVRNGSREDLTIRSKAILGGRRAYELPVGAVLVSRIAAGATETIPLLFHPPSSPPVETLFPAAFIMSGTVGGRTVSVGVSLCGVGFRNREPTTPPEAALVCP